MDQYENILEGKRASFMEKEIYGKLNYIFSFKSGKITMAISSKANIMLDIYMDIPQLMMIKEDILSCMNGSDCSMLDNILKEIGFLVALTSVFNYLVFQILLKY